MESHIDEATLVVSRRVKPGREREYADWLQRVTKVAKGFPGFLGATNLVPNDGDCDVRYVIWRFESEATLESWKSSPERLKLIGEVEEYASQHFAEATGMETWFAVPGLGGIAAPPKWKMALATILGAYFVSFCAHLLLEPSLDSWPLFASTFLYIVILVTLLTYLVMPYLSRLLRRWLYPMSRLGG